MKRIFLFLLTNLAVMLMIGIITRVFGLDRFLTAKGLNLTMLLIFSAVVGFSGAIISLLLSKTITKWSMGLHLIQQPQTHEEAWLYNTVQQLSSKAGISMPEVGIYEGDANAFATGAFKNSALVGVSTGLLRSMTKEEVEAVLAHEIAHISNGDMVTMALVQGVVNTFVVFFARVAAFAVDKFFSRDKEENVGWIYTITAFVFEIIFGIFASMIVMYVSRQREFRADSGAAKLQGNPSNMIAALRRLQQIQAGELPNGMAAFGISEPKKNHWMQLFTSHPPLETRIEALEKNRY